MGNVFTRSPAATGALLAVITLPLHLLFSKMQSEQFAAVLLVAIGAIYIGFGLQTGKSSQILVEVMAALGFFGAVLAGLWFTPWIAFGIARIIKDRGSLPYFYGIRSFAPVTTGPRREAWW